MWGAQGGAYSFGGVVAASLGRHAGWSSPQTPRPVNPTDVNKESRRAASGHRQTVKSLAAHGRVARKATRATIELEMKRL
jgi:hypothetical protein